MAKIVSLGSALQDIFLIDRDDFVATDVHSLSTSKTTELFGKLEIGTKVDIDRIRYEVGGGGTNSAVSFSRHGHESFYIGNIGRDVAGEAIIKCLQDENANVDYTSIVSRKSTGCSVILLDTHSGERTILTCRGASAKFDNLDPNILKEIKPDFLYVTTLRGDFDTLEKFFKTAHSLGVKVMFNPGKLELDQPKLLTKLLKYVTILLVNKREAAQIVPGVILTELLSRLKNYVPTAIITDGNMGGIASDGEKTYRFGIYADVPVKDTTGAGDAFGSGFLAHLAAGRKFKDALIFASANSTEVVSYFGAKAGILTGNEELHQMPIQEVKF